MGKNSVTPCRGLAERSGKAVNIAGEGMPTTRIGIVGGGFGGLATGGAPRSASAHRLPTDRVNRYLFRSLLRRVIADEEPGGVVQSA